MAMKDIGTPVVFCDFDGHAAKLAVALGVVGKVAAALTVESASIEIVGIINEEITHTGESAAICNGREP